MTNKHYDEYVLLGLNIRYYKMLTGYTQEQLSEGINISREHMAKIERAISGVSLDVMFDIAEFLKVPIHKFFEFRE